MEAAPDLSDGHPDPDRRAPVTVVRRPGRAGLAGLLVLSFWAGPAIAHDGTGLVGGFLSGFLHPLNGPDHMLAMVAVGLWGAILGRPLLVALPVVFPAMMAAGGVLGILSVPIPPVEIGIGLSVLVLGAAIGGGARPPVWAAVSVVAVFAVFHGYAHGQELPSAADPVGYSVGFVLSTGLLHLVGIGMAFLIEKTVGLRMLNGLGALIALAGLGFVYQAITA